MATPIPAETAPQRLMVPERYRVTRVRVETHDTRTLELVPLAAEPMTFAPGQFNMLYAFGVGEVPISISGDPQTADRLVHTIRTVGRTSEALCAAKRGAVLGVRGPFGSAWPIDEAKGSDIVVVSGGVGLAPLRPVVYRALADRRSYGSVSLLYGARTPADLLFRSELHEWRGRFDINVEVSVDHTAGERFENVGVVTRLIAMAKFAPTDTVAFVCGPEVMTRFSIEDLLNRGVSPDNIYLSMERNMHCALGMCGRCQLGPNFVCKDGPVFRYADVAHLLAIREL
ncbi:MAG: FAD/NAD(P)-binding protein [Gemmatimonadales bacterium]|jgi:NAD(P)H-flavin reductase